MGRGMGLAGWAELDGIGMTLQKGKAHFWGYDLAWQWQ